MCRPTDLRKLVVEYMAQKCDDFKVKLTYDNKLSELCHFFQDVTQSVDAPMYELCDNT